MLNHYIITTITVTVILAWVVRNSTDAPVIPLRLSWQPNPFRFLRVALDASCRVAVVVKTERRFGRFALSAIYALNTWRVRQVLARRLRRHSHYNPSRSEPNPIGPPELCAGLRTHRLYLFAYPDCLIHFDRSASLPTRPVSSLLLCSTELRLGQVTLVASRCLRDTH